MEHGKKSLKDYDRRPTDPPAVNDSLKASLLCFKVFRDLFLQRFPCLKSKKCQKIFKTEKWLHIHIEKNHSTLVQHVCEYCLKIFANMKSVKNHVRTQHKGDEDGFQCDQCDVKTTTMRDLQKHRVNDHIPSKCLICQKILAYGLVWRLHRKTCTKKSQGNTS